MSITRKQLDRLIKEQLIKEQGDPQTRVANVGIRFNEAEDTIYLKVASAPEVGFDTDVWKEVVRVANLYINNAD